MSNREPFEPWFHQASGFWCKKVRQKVHYLARNYKTAKKRLRQLLEAKEAGDPLACQWLAAPFATLADEFLNDIQALRAAGTYRNNREQLLRALQIIGPAIRVGEIRRFHLRKIERAMVGKYSAATVRDTLSSVQHVFNWAIEMELLDSTPIAKYKKPAGGNRSRITTPEEFQALLRHTDRSFQRFLIALRATGCRPGEVRSLLWTMVDLDNGLWVLPRHKTVTMQREPLPRVIPLPSAVLKLCHWLARKPHRTDDHVFVNQRGVPYSKDCCVRKMDRLRKRAGIEVKNGENLVLYSNRHAYATNAVGKVSDVELAEVMGHTTTRTLRRYVHLNAERLRAIQQRIQS